MIFYKLASQFLLYVNDFLIRVSTALGHLKSEEYFDPYLTRCKVGTNDSKGSHWFSNSLFNPA